jgi:hypothetical protein
MNWNVTMIPAKFLGRRGGSTANAIKALDYLIDLKSRYGINLVATNNSWGGGGFSQALLDAINAAATPASCSSPRPATAAADGVGDNNDTTPNYPSNYVCQSSNGDCVIAVAAITSTGGAVELLELRRDEGGPWRSRLAIYSTVPARTARRRMRRTAARRWPRRT